MSKSTLTTGLQKADIAEAVGLAQSLSRKEMQSMTDNSNALMGIPFDLFGDTFVIGEALFIRTVTHHLTGRVQRLSQCGGIVFLHLEEAAWIADDGRFSDAMNKGELKEIEPIDHPIRLSVATILDVYHWNFPLPRKQK